MSDVFCCMCIYCKDHTDPEAEHQCLFNSRDAKNYFHKFKLPKCCKIINANNDCPDYVVNKKAYEKEKE